MSPPPPPPPDISTHSAREDGDMFPWSSVFGCKISTHSAREDGDSTFLPLTYAYIYFNPLRPRGRRLNICRCLLCYDDFNPLRPRGRRLQRCSIHTTPIAFQPTPPARTETAILHKKTNNSSSHFHNQITSYSLKSPPTCPAHIQNRSHCAVFPVRIPP